MKKPHIENAEHPDCAITTTSIDINQKELLTIREASVILGCHKSTLYRLIYQRRLKICPAFKRMRISRKEIELLISEAKFYDGRQS